MRVGLGVSLGIGRANLVGAAVLEAVIVAVGVDEDAAIASRGRLLLAISTLLTKTTIHPIRKIAPTKMKKIL